MFSRYSPRISSATAFWSRLRSRIDWLSEACWLWEAGAIIISPGKYNMLSPIELKQLVQLSDLDSSLELSGLFDCGELLSDEGVSVARRTVAKYREELGIEPSWARRRR